MRQAFNYLREYPDLAGKAWFEDSERLILAHKWDDVLKIVQSNHGKRPKVAVYPNGEVQYCQYPSAC